MTIRERRSNVVSHCFSRKSYKPTLNPPTGGARKANRVRGKPTSVETSPEGSLLPEEQLLIDRTPRCQRHPIGGD